MEKKSKKYDAVTYPDSDHPIYGIGMTPREAWEDFLPDACISMHSKDQMRLGMPDELREMDSEEWERLGIVDLVEMDVMRCSKALYDEVQKHGGNISYACDRNGMLVTEDEMQAEDERIELAERAVEDRIYDEGLSAYEAGKPETSNPYCHGTEERISWNIGWTSGRLHLATSKTNDEEGLMIEIRIRNKERERKEES